MIGKLLAVAIIFALLTVLLGKWIVVPILILIILWIIRIIADLFWMGKDKEWW